MNMDWLKEHPHEYLGFCEQKGFIYSVEVAPKTYRIVAVQDGDFTTLITHTVKGDN